MTKINLNNVLMWVGVNLALVTTWSGSVAKGYLPFIPNAAIYWVLLFTLSCLGLTVFYYVKDSQEVEE